VKRSAINVSVKVKVINERRKYNSTPFATSELGGVGGHRQPLAALTPGKRPGTHSTGSCVGTRVGVDGHTENFAPTGIRSSDCSTRSESLYRLGYAGRQVCWQWIYIIKICVCACVCVGGGRRDPTVNVQKNKPLRTVKPHC
jgi:hypothetical protein